MTLITFISDRAALEAEDGVEIGMGQGLLLDLGSDHRCCYTINYSFMSLSMCVFLM